MTQLFNAKYLSMPQQVQKNKEDIEKLNKQLFEIYNTQQSLSNESSSILTSETNIDINKIENALLISSNGLVFKIESIDESETVAFLTFYSSLQGPEGPRGPQGTEGPEGPRGPQGVTGARGPKGDTGERGPQGLQGIQGIPGENGNSFEVTGTVNSVVDLPPASDTAEGTAYFVGTTYPRDVYVVVNYQGAKIWQNQGKLQGPIGPEGPIGPQGEKGPEGEGFNFMGVWVEDNEYFKNDIVTYETENTKSSYILITDTLVGSVVPPNEDVENWQVFTQGTQGPEGPRGPQGVEGPQGATGPQGPIGPVGPIGPAGPKAKYNVYGAGNDALFCTRIFIGDFIDPSGNIYTNYAFTILSGKIYGLGGNQQVTKSWNFRIEYPQGFCNSVIQGTAYRSNCSVTNTSFTEITIRQNENNTPLIDWFVIGFSKWEE